MHTLYQRALEELSYIDKEIRSITKELTKYPEEKLIITKNENRFKWYVRTGEGLKYLSKKERTYAVKLAKRKYLMMKKKDLEREKRAISSYIRHCSKDMLESEKLWKPENGYTELLEEKKTGNMPEQYDANPLYPEQRIHKSPSGRMLRSKSEAKIDELLFRYGLEYHYEEIVVLGNRIVYPDFTIYDEKRKRKVYWEHFGRMDDPEYVKRAIEKIREYIENGIIPQRDLIITYETKDMPLDYEVVEMMIKYHFM